MKIKSLVAPLLLFSLLAVSCDDTTDTLGKSLTEAAAHVLISTDTFTVSSRSIKVDSVLARTSTGNLGRIKDPETGTYITCDFATQFHMLDSAQYTSIMPKDSLYSYKYEGGTIRADSCRLLVFFDSWEGDSMASVKVSLNEMAKPMLENRKYYTNFNPEDEGYLRKTTDDNAISIEKTYTLADLTYPTDQLDYYTTYKAIHFALNDPYVDVSGNEYESYGTYLLQKFYENPKNFMNSIKFANNVCPGFYLKTEGGEGSMAYVNATELIFYFTVEMNDTLYARYFSIAGTEEVLQHTTVSNDEALEDLVNDNSCTYLKTPAGIFTEVELPVDDIMRGYENDTLNTVELTLTRLNNETVSDYSLDYPSTLLLIQKDSLYSYFENACLPDNKESYLTSYSSNTYTFHNISALVRHMYTLKQSGKASADWNKVVIIPVETTLNSSSVVMKVNHLMDITSTKLVGGSENKNGDIKVNVIYSKFTDEQ